MASTGVVGAGWAAAAALGMRLSIMGCGVPRSASGAAAETTPPITPTVEGNTEPTAAAVTSDPFAKTIPWPVTPGVRSSLAGTLGSSEQVDVFDIGPAYAGDRLHVEVLASAELDAALAVFDADQNLMIANDDRSYYGGLTDPLADAVVMHDTPGCLVAVSISPTASSSGAYTLELLLTEGDAPGPPTPQRVYLNFDGASGVTIGTRPPVEVPVFDAASIDVCFAGNTDQIADNVEAMVRDDFTGLDVQFYSSREGLPPAEPYTTIHFGAYDAALLGIAENVDEYNEQPSQQAIVFVDTFAAFAVVQPSVEEISQALANVASHETGHLLGLQHTYDSRSIMDVTANLRQMLGDQSFSRSPLNPADVFPIGYQDAPQLLFESVGGDLTVARQASLMKRAAPRTWYDEGVGPPARGQLVFGTCGRCIRAKAKRQAALSAAQGDPLGR